MSAQPTNQADKGFDVMIGLIVTCAVVLVAGLLGMVVYNRWATQRAEADKKAKAEKDEAKRAVYAGPNDSPTHDREKDDEAPASPPALEEEAPPPDEQEHTPRHAPAEAGRAKPVAADYV